MNIPISPKKSHKSPRKKNPSFCFFFHQKRRLYIYLKTINHFILKKFRKKKDFCLLSIAFVSTENALKIVDYL